MTPNILASAPRRWPRSRPEVRAYGADKIKQLKMGAFWESRKAPMNRRADRVALRTDGRGERRAPRAGWKRVTFDTGGISIKPADGMEKMKYDMAGAHMIAPCARSRCSSRR